MRPIQWTAGARAVVLTNGCGGLNPAWGPGTPVLVEFSLRGYEKAKHRTVCPHDALVKVTARMRKGSGKASGKK